MTSVNTSTKLNVSADTVWNMIGQFGTVAKWHPAIEKSEQRNEDGATVRELSLTGGGTIVERLEESNDGDRFYTYSIVSGPIPVTNYTATIKVKPNDGNSCTVEWGSEFDPAGVGEDEAAGIIRGIYEAGFDNLKSMFGG